MKSFINGVCLLLCSFLLMTSCQQQNTNSDKSSQSSENLPTKKVEFAMVIHGGAGTILKENMTDEKEAEYRKALNEAITIGENILRTGGSSKDAVIRTISYLENSPLFNAGRGAVFANDGTNKHDASIMRGIDLEAGAIGGVSTIKNPITAALAVLENSEHVFLSGKGAEEFAKTQNIEFVDPKYFYTESRWNSLQKALEKDKEISLNATEMVDSKFGTVGAVALDKNGDIVAGTSTGGMTNKKFDRIGDSPIIGAGTYANNKTCGVSCTGHGEFFIRYAVAHDLSAMLEYTDKTLEEAADYIINKKLKDVNGSGGLIALDKYGNISMPFNTAGMYRAFVTNKDKFIGIYSED
jgi:beta-aspartyl-peptidase (threonine type)